MFQVLFIPETSFHRFVVAILHNGSLLYKPKLKLKILYGDYLFAHTCIVHTLVFKAGWQEIRKTMTLSYSYHSRETNLNNPYSHLCIQLFQLHRFRQCIFQRLQNSVRNQCQSSHTSRSNFGHCISQRPQLRRSKRQHTPLDLRSEKAINYLVQLSFILFR